MSTPITKSKMQPQAAVPAKNVSENALKGTLLALLAIPVGVFLWVLIWRWGFIASIVAFAIAWLAAKLYTFGAGSITRRGAYIVMVISIIGVILSLFGMIVSDALQYVSQEFKISETELLTDGNFWRYIWELMGDSALWSEYKTDILISVAFAGLGMFFTLKDLFIASMKSK